jgi:hypothetical protein
MRCPLCELEVADGTSRCWSCGYDFDTDDARPALRRAKQQVWRANTMWVAGMALVFLAPALVFQTIIIVGLLGGAVVASTGVTLVTFGLINGDRAKKRLVALEKRTALPPARIV